MRSISIAFLAVVAMTSCKKRPDPVSNPTPGKGTPVTEKVTSIKIAFQNVVGSEKLILNTKTYLNENKDSFIVSDYTYYISNIKLYTEDGIVYAEPESYHLISAEVDSSQNFVIKNLPEGRYNKMTFMIGVDSARNISGAQTGALDPVHGMFWDWNSGYVMARLEGSSPQSTVNNMIAYHLGGFRGENSVLRNVSLNFPEIVEINKDKQPSVNINSDVAEWFKTPVTIDFSKLPVMALEGIDAMMIADNYKDMFTVSSIKQ